MTVQDLRFDYVVLITTINSQGCVEVNKCMYTSMYQIIKIKQKKIKSPSSLLNHWNQQSSLVLT